MGGRSRQGRFFCAGPSPLPKVSSPDPSKTMDGLETGPLSLPRLILLESLRPTSRMLKIDVDVAIHPHIDDGLVGGGRPYPLSGRRPGLVLRSRRRPCDGERNCGLHAYRRLLPKPRTGQRTRRPRMQRLRICLPSGRQTLRRTEPDFRFACHHGRRRFGLVSNGRRRLCRFHLVGRSLRSSRLAIPP